MPTSSVELCLMSPEVPVLPTVIRHPLDEDLSETYQPDDLSDLEEEEEEDFEDAQEFLPTSTVPEISHDTNAAATPCSKPIHTSNIIQLGGAFAKTVMTIIALASVAFFYIQYRQQEFSNEMSAWQTCLALKAAGDNSNSSFCNKTMQHDMWALDKRSMVLENDDKIRPLHVLLKKYSPGFPTSLKSIASMLVLLMSSITVSILLKVSAWRITRIGSRNSTSKSAFAPSIHVAQEIPRLSPTNLKAVTFHQENKVEASTDNEHMYYIQSQATLTEKMQAWSSDTTYDPQRMYIEVQAPMTKTLREIDQLMKTAEAAKLRRVNSSKRRRQPRGSAAAYDTDGLRPLSSQPPSEAEYRNSLTEDSTHFGLDQDETRTDESMRNVNAPGPSKRWSQQLKRDIPRDSPLTPFLQRPSKVFEQTRSSMIHAASSSIPDVVDPRRLALSSNPL